MVCDVSTRWNSTAELVQHALELSPALNNEDLPLVVRHAALQGFFMLNKYYSLTDESIVYRVAMSMCLLLPIFPT